MFDNSAAPGMTASTGSTVAVFERQREERQRAGRRLTLLYGGLFLACVCGALLVGRFDLPNLIRNLPRVTEYLERLLPVLRPTHLAEDAGTWFYGIDLWSWQLLETILMAFLATLLGTIGATILCFPASQNLTRNAAVVFFSRRLLEIARTVPDLVYALIFVFAFGLGPLAGILAIAIHSAGASGKLFAEVNENVDLGAFDGVRAAGGNWVKAIRLAVIPQVLPNFATYTLWRFELNVRTAAVIGFVGAGGIGQELFTAIRVQYYEDVSAIVLMLVATVCLIDMACERLRHRLIGKESPV